MAFPAGFAESNLNLGKPGDMTDEECSSLCVYKGVLGKTPIITSCFKLTKVELEEINRTARVWVTFAGQSMPPVIIEGIKPEHLKKDKN